ncbi:hypothetical protein C6501_09080 [Candidatus Poribacteria bacterium]|nr:MAG: hypothetical protein C6501_09080 [Candidatus Poribacteria bacterium]
MARISDGSTQDTSNNPAIDKVDLTDKYFTIEEISDLLYLMDNDFRSHTENFVFVLKELPEDILVFKNYKSALSDSKVKSFFSDSKSWTIENCKYPLETFRVGNGVVSLPIEGMPQLNISFTSKSEYYKFIISLPTNPNKGILDQWWIIPSTYIVGIDKYYVWTITPHWQQPKVVCN